MKCIKNNKYEDVPIEKLFLDLEKSKDSPSEELRNEIQKRFVENAPSDIQVRLQLMGFTPLTYIGFALAGVILSLNSILGTGWAGDLVFGENLQTISEQTSDGFGYKVLKLNSKENLLK